MEREGRGLKEGKEEDKVPRTKWSDSRPGISAHWWNRVTECDNSGVLGLKCWLSHQPWGKLLTLLDSSVKCIHTLYPKHSQDKHQAPDKPRVSIRRPGPWQLVALSKASECTELSSRGLPGNWSAPASGSCQELSEAHA